MSEKKTCEKIIEVTIPSEIGTSHFEEAARKVQKKVQVKGFRRGKVPIDIVKTRFKADIVEQMLKDLLPKIAREEVEKARIDAIDTPIIDDVDVKDDLSIDVKIRVYVWPDIKLAKYKKLKLKKKDEKVTEKDVEKALETYRRALLPKEEQNKEDIKQKDLPQLTDEAVKKWGFDSVEALKEDVKKRLEENKRMEAKQDLDRQVREFLLKNSKLDVPETWINRQFEQKLRSFAANLSQLGLGQEQIRQMLEARKDDILASAEDDVKLFFIIEEIARQEGIEASDEEIDVEVEKMAEKYKISKEEMKRYIEERTGWDNFCLDIDHDKVWRYLIDNAIK